MCNIILTAAEDYDVIDPGAGVILRIMLLLTAALPVKKKQYGAGVKVKSLVEPRSYLTLAYLWEWAGSYTCPALRPYQFGPMRISECNCR